MKRLNVLIQNSKKNTSAELQVSFIYGVPVLVEIVESLTLPEGVFTSRDLVDLRSWLIDAIVKIEDKVLTDTSYTIGNRTVRLYMK
jgi:hypothetical protein